MNIILKIRDGIRKLQGLPESQRRTIMWVTIGILAVIGSIIWFKIAEYKLKKMDTSHLFPPGAEIQNPLIIPGMPDASGTDSGEGNLETN